MELLLPIEFKESNLNLNRFSPFFFASQISKYLFTSNKKQHRNEDFLSLLSSFKKEQMPDACDFFGFGLFCLFVWVF